MRQERAKMILNELEEQGFVKVAELSKKFGCSEVTIRSDIKNLEEQGLLQRTHGGAAKIGLQFSQHYTGKSIYDHVERKTAIARRAYEFIEDNDTIIIDDASTTLYLTKYIKNDPSKHLVVVTNSLPVATELAEVSHVDLFMTGGQVSGSLAAVMGDLTVSNLGGFLVDKAFIGTKGVNFKVGITSVAYPQMQVKRAIIKSSKSVYVLADSSKFGSAYLSVVCPLDQVTAIVTDSSVSDENIEKAKTAGIPMYVSERVKDK